VLRRIFGPRRDEVTGGWRGLHNLQSSPGIIRMAKPRRITMAVHVVWMGEKRKAYRSLMVKPEGKREVGGCIILRWISRRQDGVVLDCIVLTQDGD
jgi:hypothetical protein